MHTRIMAFLIGILNRGLGIAPAGLRPRLVRAKFALIANPNAGFQTDSLLIWRGGKLLHEEYRDGYDENKPHFLHSGTWAVLSALTGIAIEQGHIQGVDQKVADFYPDVEIAPGQESKRDLTVKHLLTMTTGLDDITIEDEAFWDAPDPGKAIFALPFAAAPNKALNHRIASGLSVGLLSGLLTRAVGKSVLAYANETLFGPLGITKAGWEAGENGVYSAWGLHLTSRDMLRLGQLYLNEGRFEGRQIIPAAWVAQSRPAAEGRGKRAYWDQAPYGYHFFPFEGNGFAARGYGGQYIVVDPDSNTVIVRTGTYGPELGFFRYLFPLLRMLLTGR